jgi:tetratricopeptide (TPR) repeat protein
MTTDSQKKELQALLRNGFTALSQGDFNLAGKYCQQVLAIKPDMVQGHFLVGLIGLEAKDRKTAFSAFQSVVKLDPDHAAAWAHLSKLYMSEGQVNLADKALAEMRRIGSTDPLVLDLAGTTLSLMGEHQLAQSFFRQANQKAPKHLPFMQNLANNYVYFGETKKADTLFEQIIELQPNNPQAHWSLASSRKAKDSSHIEQMQQFTQTEHSHPRALAFYLYAIGKEHEDLQQWQPAFEAFAAGAKARRATVEFDDASEKSMFDYLSQHYDRDWFDGLNEGNPSDAPIFVLGQPRTGTTLVERIITSHSKVHSAGELQQFGLALRRLSNYSDPKRFSKELFEKARSLDPLKVGNMYLQTTGKVRGDTPHFVDKLPQNYLLIPLILKALPNAKIVHLVRNPMDACFASYKQLFADAYLHSYDQVEMANHHARYRRLMSLWHQRFPGRIFDISYEETARDLEPNARALIEYLNLPWEDACLNFHELSSAVSTASATQVREPAHTRSIDRWKRYQDQLQPMITALKQQDIAVD